MTRPSRSTVNGWDLMSLDAAATALDAAVTDLRDLTQRMADAPMRAGDSRKWMGDSQLGCENRTESDRVEINKLGSDLTHAATVLRDTASAISPNRTTALIKALGLERDQFSVADDWTVRDTRDYAAELTGVEAGSATERAILDAQAARAEEARTATLSLHSLADQMGEDDRNGARVLATAFGDAGANAPISSSYSPGQASIDVQAIMSGTATIEQKGRFFRATSLTPEQRAALARGDHAVIPKEQFDYLKAIYTPSWGPGPQGQPFSLEALKSFGDKYTGAEQENFKQGLADGVFMLGNPHLRTEQSDSNPFAEIYGTNAPFVSGGMNQLSTPLREALTSAAAGKGQLNLPDAGAHSGGHRSVTNLMTFDDLKSVMEILEHRSVDPSGSGYGSESAQLGSDVDRALIARAGELAASGERPFVSNLGSFSHDNVSRDELEGLMVRMLDVAGNDHIAVHDAVASAAGEPSNTSMPKVFDLDGNEKSFKDAQLLKHLFTFDWTDQAGREGEGVNKLFNWMPGVANTPDQATAEQMADSVRSGEVASALARFIADNKVDFGDINGSPESLGARNPELTRTLASSLAPYLAELGGADSDIFETRGVVPLDDAYDFKALFHIMDTDPHAGRIINTNAMLQASALEQIFGADASRAGLGEVVGRLHGAMTGGLNEMLDEDVADKRYEAARNYALHGAAFDSVKSLGLAAPNLNPLFKTFVDVSSPALKLGVVGMPPDPDDISPDVKFNEVRASVFRGTNLDSVYQGLLEGYIRSNPSFLDSAEMRDIYGDRMDDPKFVDSLRRNGLADGGDTNKINSVVQDLFGDRDNDFLDEYENQLNRMKDPKLPKGAGW